MDNEIYKGIKEPTQEKLWFLPIGDDQYQLKVYGTGGWKGCLDKGLLWDALENYDGIHYINPKYLSGLMDGYVTFDDLVWNNIKDKPSTFPPSAHKHTWSDITNTPTTIAGYGITDLKISNGVITIGKDSITPLTKHQTFEDLIATMSVGASDITDGTELVTSYASDNGFSDTNAPNIPYKREAIHLYNYIAGKIGAPWSNIKWSDIKEKPTTIAGFGITDLKIDKGVITIGSNTITPITEHQSLADYITKETLNSTIADMKLASTGGDGKYIQSIAQANGIISAVAIDFPTKVSQFENDAKYITADDVNGNTSSATKLETARKIWGQSFDGTADVSGDLSSKYFWIFDSQLNPRIQLTVDKINYLLSATENGISLCTQDNNGLIVDSKGNIGVGKLSPTCKLDVSGDMMVSGNLTAYDTLLTRTTSSMSDERLKEITGKVIIPIESIAKAPSVNFIWKDGPEGLKAGTIAQYWKNIVPAAVHTEKDGYLSMQYDVIALLSVISSAKRILNHEKRLRILEDEMNKMKY